MLLEKLRRLEQAYYYILLGEKCYLDRCGPLKSHDRRCFTFKIRIKCLSRFLQQIHEADWEECSYRRFGEMHEDINLNLFLNPKTKY